MFALRNTSTTALTASRRLSPCWKSIFIATSNNGTVQSPALASVQQQQQYSSMSTSLTVYPMSQSLLIPESIKSLSTWRMLVEAWVQEGIFWISTLKRRRKMMNKHKLRKRRKKNRMSTRK